MIRQIIYLILIVCTNSICLSQTNLDRSQNDCYIDEIRLNTRENEFKDTVILVRNYIDNIDDKRVLCNNLSVDNDIYRLIWECKYIKTYLTYQNKMNKYSIVAYRQDNHNNTIAFYFLCDRKTKETGEMIRFKISNKKIIGINILPNTYDGFVPIDEFDNQKTDKID